MSLADLDFTAVMGRSLDGVRRGLLVKPLIETYLHDVDLPAMTIRLGREDGRARRAYDGWFHPSTHPLWSPRALYEYLVSPGNLPVEVKEHSGTLSVNVGKLLHDFIACCLGHIGVLPPDLQRCTVCPQTKRKCKEPGFEDLETGSRTHVDGVLALPDRPRGGDLWEFKTSNERRVQAIDDLDLDTFREKWPGYYAQAQECQRISGRRLTVLVVMSLGWPWHLREFHIPYDRRFAEETRQRYLDVRQAAGRKAPPSCSCSPTASRGCPARVVCG